MVSVYVCRLDTRIAPEQWSDLMGRVSPTEQIRIQRFRMRADRERTLVGRILMRRVLAHQLECDEDDLAFERTRFGRPYLVHPALSHGDFNLAHHGKWVMLAVTDRGRVGIDIANPREMDDLVRHSMLALEEEAIAEHEDLARMWALKEAVLKMRGTGLLVDPRSLRFDTAAWGRGQYRLLGPLQQEPYLETFQMDDDFQVGIAVEVSFPALNWVYVPLSRLIDGPLSTDIPRRMP